MKLHPNYYKAIEEHILRGNNFLIFCKANPIPIISDLFIRLAIIILYKANLISFNITLFLQFIILPLFTVVIVYLISKSITIKLTGKIKNYSISADLGHYSLGFIIVSNIGIWFILDNFLLDFSFSNWILKLIVQFGIFVILAFYQFIIIDKSYSKDIENIVFYPNDKDSKYCCTLELFEHYNESNLIDRDNTELKELDDIEIEIENIGIKLENIKQKFEAFTVESTFLGGICFAGFLTIISSDKVQDNLTYFKEVPKLLVQLLNSFLKFDYDNIVNYFSKILSGYSLYGLIATQTLICAVIFMLVLVGRVKFLDYYDILQTKYYKLKILNAKFNSEENDVQCKSDKLNLSITQQLFQVQASVYSSVPFFQMISLIRYFGILSFYILILTSSMIFSYKLSLILLSLLLFEFIFRSLINKYYLKLSKK